ncbi:MAG: 50S ribosomal protein L9 [Planctomycetota bacterium]
MRVVLRKTIPELGTVGEVVIVKRGYARNFLLPRGLAYLVTQDNLKRLESEKKSVIRQMEEEKAQFDALAKELDGKSFTLQRNATEEGHLYGSVDASAVVEALGAEGIEVDEKTVNLADPIKELGIYEVEIQLHPEVAATTKIWVVSDEEKEKSAEAGEEEAASEG